MLFSQRLVHLMSHIMYSSAFFFVLTYVGCVDFVECGLSSLPHSIVGCVSLERLWASDNRLTHLPEPLASLTALTDLFLQVSTNVCMCRVVLCVCRCMQCHCHCGM